MARVSPVEGRQVLDRQRPKLEACLDYLREEDVLTVLTSTISVAGSAN